MGYDPVIVLVLGIGAAVAIGVAAIRARRTDTASPVMSVAWVVSSVWAVVTLAAAILITVMWFTPMTYPFFEIRTNSFWPAANGGGDGAFPEDEDDLIVWSGFTNADITAAGLSLGTRAMLATGDLIGSLVTVAIACLIAVTCRRLIQGRPFAPELARLSLVAASVCLVGGIGSQVFLGIRGGRALAEIIAAGAAPAGLTPEMSPSIDLWPIAAAMGLGVFSVLMRYGSRLQHDTRGLV